MDVKIALEHYLGTLENPTTKTNYEIVLRDFLEDVRVVGQVTTNRIRNYKKRLSDKAPQTVAARLAAIRSFCDFCWERGWLAQDPSLTIKVKPISKYSKAKNIDFADLKKVLSQIDLETLVGLRDYILIRLLFKYGNAKKILNLKWDQSLSDDFVQVVEKYKNLVENKADSNGYMFFNLDRNNSKALSLSGARKILNKYATKAGFPDKFLDFQALKRLRAKQIFEQTNNLESVQKFCGHKSLKATKAFIKTLD